MVNAHSTTKTVTDKAKYNWDNNHALDAKHAHQDKFLVLTTYAQFQDQLVHAINLLMLQTNARLAQQDNSAKVEKHAKQFHNNATEMDKFN
jgi:hypothetical protein